MNLLSLTITYLRATYKVENRRSCLYAAGDKYVIKKEKQIRMLRQQWNNRKFRFMLNGKNKIYIYMYPRKWQNISVWICITKSRWRNDPKVFKDYLWWSGAVKNANGLCVSSAIRMSIWDTLRDPSGCCKRHRQNTAQQPVRLNQVKGQRMF